MRIRVRLFAMQRQQLGVRELPLDLPDGATIGEAWSALAALHPVLAPAGPTLRFARNAAYADPAEPLAEGDELALIPPVAGGAGPAADPGPYRRIELRVAPFDDALLADLRHAVATEADGAVLLFLGQTRASPGTPAPGQEAEAARHAGRTVLALDYEAFEPMALAVLGQVADEIAERFGVTRLAILHRIGEVPLGEASVVIAVASGHRGEAFEACRYAIEELKARTPIWKSERFTDGSVWIGAPARTAADPPA
ncbi:MAG: molybdenum cofactor biosynthesis protein MoaE [Chloroflexota bacterium]